MAGHTDSEAQPKTTAPETVGAALWGNLTLAGPPPFAEQGPATVTDATSSSQQDPGASKSAWPPSSPSSTSSPSTSLPKKKQANPPTHPAPAASFDGRILDPVAAHGRPVQAPARTHETSDFYKYSSRRHALRVDHSAPFATSDAPAKSYSYSVRIGNNHATDIHRTWRPIYQTFDTLGNAMLAIRADAGVVAEGGQVEISILRADGRVLKTQIQPMGYQQRRIVPALWAEVHEFEVEESEGGRSKQVSTDEQAQ